jgi:transposase
VTDEPLYRNRVCGTGIGKAQMVATIRVPPDRDPARWSAGTRTFATTKRGVLALAGWCRSWQVPAVVMEAASGYWKGPFCRLEAGGPGARVRAGRRRAGQEPARPPGAGPG